MAIYSSQARTLAKANPFQKFASVEAARFGVEEGAAGFYAIAITHVFSAIYAWRFPFSTLVTRDPNTTAPLLLVLAAVAMVGGFYLRAVPNRFVALGMTAWAIVGLAYPFTRWIYGWAAFSAFNLVGVLAGILATRAAFALVELRKAQAK
ncbi:hypothetical protein [Brevundimonas sp. G8]|uniref:hypothetical protein n=1 Tax=Brevundimonas sp. G8 TaxID=1350776 RepID=UPI0013594965|nr:hypothetical protein [Brevundimonas sp. G8]